MPDHGHGPERYQTLEGGPASWDGRRWVAPAAPSPSRSRASVVLVVGAGLVLALLFAVGGRGGDPADEVRTGSEGPIATVDPESTESFRRPSTTFTTRPTEPAPASTVDPAAATEPPTGGR